MMKKIFYSDENGKIHPLSWGLNFLCVTFFLYMIVMFSLDKIGITLNFSFLWDFQTRMEKGFWMTVKISLWSMVASLVLGVVVAFGSTSKVIFIRILCQVYVKIIRGTPLIMQIYLFYYIIGTALGVSDRMVAGIIILSLFEGAYIAEIIRGSLLSMDKLQLEVAKSVGFTEGQTLRLVILPQLITRTLPSLTGQFASIIKDSSLLSVISVIELTQTIREITAINLKMFEAYFFLGILYLCLTLPVSFFSEMLERKFQYAGRDS